MRFSEEVAKGRASGNPPQFVGEVFDESGHPIPMSGCTIHGFQRGAEAVAAIGRACERIRAASPDRCWVWLPEDSWHMTWIRLLDRRSEGDPNQRADWQGDLRGREADNAMLQRLRGADVGARPPFHFSYDGHWHYGFVMGFWLAGNTESEAERILAMQGRMEEAAGLEHRPRGIEFRTHLTLGYLLDWPNESEAEAIERAIDEADAELSARDIVFEFGPPEACLFDDLTEFRPQFSL